MTIVIGKAHGWAHDRAKHIRKKNPDLPEGAEYGIAQLQEVAVGKEKDGGGKVKPSTKTKAKKKHKKSPKSYEQKAAPKSKSKKSKKRKTAMKDLMEMIINASNHFDSVGEVGLADTLDKIGARLAKFADKKDKDGPDHLKLKDHSCGCDGEPKDSNSNGICDECGLVYSEECNCGETDMTGYCLGCSSTQPLMRVMVVSEDPMEESVLAHFDEDGKLIKVSDVKKEVGSAVGGGAGYVAGKTLGGIAGTVAGSMIGMPGVGAAVGSGIGGAAGAGVGSGAGAAVTSSAKGALIKSAQELVAQAEALDTLSKSDYSIHLDAILEKLAEAEMGTSEGSCCDSPRDNNSNGVCDCCGDVGLDGCGCGSTHVVGRCNKCGAGNLLQLSLIHI